MDINIDSLSDFVKVITENNNKHFYHDIAHLQIVYRGHANINWNLIPSAFRSDDDFLNERIYLRECLREIPEEFDALNFFDTLVKVQHYGVPTRLLDFTLNPLVALYFSCIGENDEDGCVIAIGPIRKH